MRTIDLREGIVRVLSRDRQKVLGTGFLVTDTLIVTCSHVLDSLTDAEHKAVCLEVLQSQEKATARLRVKNSSPEHLADIAVLELTRPLLGPFSQLPLGIASQGGDHGFTTFGFPRGFEDTGTWARGTIGYTTGAGVYRKLLLHDSDVREGFSGGPLFDVQSRRVVGVVRFRLETQGQRRDAYASPTELLLEQCPELRATEDCPYQGLASFRESDARFWKGRERVLEEELLPRLAKLPRFMEVSGPSGCGKSSLLHAGLIPALRRGVAIPGSNQWDVLAFRPGLEPISALEKAGLGGEGDLLARVRAWHDANLEPGRRLVLVIDQFEDLVLRGNVGQEERQRFLQQLAALEDEELPVTCVVALREGFDAPLSERAPRLRSLLGKHRVQVPSVLTPSDLRDIIIGPAREVGLHFDPPEMVDSIILAAQQEFPVETGAGARAIVLPLLEVTLTSLWQASRDGAMTLGAFNAGTGLRGTLGRWANSVYEGRALAASRHKLADRLLLELVQLGGAEDGSGDKGRRVPLETLRERLGAPEEVDAVLQVLVNERLLVTARDGQRQQETVELIHDALLTHWERFKKLRTRNRAFRLWHEEVQTGAERWAAAARGPSPLGAEARLLRGDELDTARRMLENHAGEVSEVALRFIAHSQQAEQAQQKKELARASQMQKLRDEAVHHLWVALGLLVVAAGAAIAFALAKEEAQENEQKAQENEQKALDSMAKVALGARRSEADVVVGLARRPGNELEALTRAIRLMGARPSGPDLAEEEVTEALTESIAAFLYSAPTGLKISEVMLVSAFSHDSRYVVTRGIFLGSSPMLRTRVWDVRNWSMVAPLESAALCSESESSDCLRTFLEEGLARLTHGFGFSPKDASLWLGGTDGALRWWRAGHPPIVLAGSHSAAITSVSFTTRGDHVLSASQDGTAQLWDADGRAVGDRLRLGEPCTQAVLSGDGRYALIGGAKRTCLFELATGTRRCFETGETGPTLAFSPSGELAVLGDRHGSGSLQLLEVKTGALRRIPSGAQGGHVFMPFFEDECSVTAFNEFGLSALTTSFCQKSPGPRPDGQSTTGKPWEPLTLESTRVLGDGRRQHTLSRSLAPHDPFVREPRSMALHLRRLGAQAKETPRAVVSPDHRILLTHTGLGFERKALDIETWDHRIEGVRAISPDLRWVIKRDPTDGRIGLMAPESSERTDLGGCGAAGGSVLWEAEFTSDGRHLTVRCEDQVQHWELAEHPPRARRTPATPEHRAPMAADARRPDFLRVGGQAPQDVHSLHYSPDGKSAVTISRNAKSPELWDATLWHTATGSVLAQAPTSREPTLVAFSPSSRTVALASLPKHVSMAHLSVRRLLQNAAPPFRLEFIASRPRALAFTSDGTRIILVSDTSIQIIRPAGKAGQGIVSIDWPDGAPWEIVQVGGLFTVRSNEAKTLQLWRPDDGRHVATLHGTRSWRSVRANAEGDRIAVLEGEDARFFSLRADDQLQKACGLMRGRLDYEDVWEICDKAIAPGNQVRTDTTSH